MKLLVVGRIDPRGKKFAPEMLDWASGKALPKTRIIFDLGLTRDCLVGLVIDPAMPHSRTDPRPHGTIVQEEAFAAASDTPGDVTDVT